MASAMQNLASEPGSVLGLACPEGSPHDGMRVETAATLSVSYADWGNEDGRLHNNFPQPLSA